MLHILNALSWYTCSQFSAVHFSWVSFFKKPCHIYNTLSLLGAILYGHKTHGVKSFFIFLVFGHSLNGATHSLQSIANITTVLPFDKKNQGEWGDKNLVVGLCLWSSHRVEQSPLLRIVHIKLSLKFNHLQQTHWAIRMRKWPLHQKKRSFF